MSVYSTIRVNDREGQVKLWEDDYRSYTVGSHVPEFHGYGYYSIAMREGGYLNIKNCKVVSWVDMALYRNVFDKWGNDFELPGTDARDFLGFPYFSLPETPRCQLHFVGLWV